MKFLDKLGLAVFSIITITLSIVICLIAFGWVDISIITVALSAALATQNGIYITVGVAIVLILLAMKCIFFPSWEKCKASSDDDEGILLQNDNGKLLITKGTIKNLVTGVVEEFKEIQDSYSQVEINAVNDVFVNVTINVYKGAVIKDVTSKLQNNVKTAIKKATDLEIKEINIKVNDVEPVKEEDSNGNSKTENN